MLCENCRKREATVHFQKIVNGKVETKHYCALCMEKLSGTAVFDGMNLADLLLKVKEAVEQNGGDGGPAECPPDASGITCPVCSWDLERFLKTESCGCPECYQAFRKYMGKILKKYHTKQVHTGKVPLQTGSLAGKNTRGMLLRQLYGLQKELKFMVEKEEYELAAKLRDEIAELTKLLSGEGEKA